MKLKKLSIALVLAAGVISLASCGKKQPAKTGDKPISTETGNTPVSTKTGDVSVPTNTGVVISTPIEDESAKYKVSKEVFNALFKLDSYSALSNLNFTIDMTNKLGEEKTDVKVEFDGTKILLTDGFFSSQMFLELEKINSDMYANIAYKEKDSDWNKSVALKVTPDEVLNNLYLANFNFSSFTFDETTNSYKSTSTFTNQFFNGEVFVVRTFSNVELKFEYGVPVSVKYDMKQNMFDYDETEFTDENAIFSYNYETSYTISKIGETEVVNPLPNDDGKYDLTIEVEGSGEVTGAGEYNAKAAAEITAKPAAGYVFVGWYIDGEYYSDATTELIEMTSDITILAVFEEDVILYELSLDANGAEGNPEAELIKGNSYVLPEETDEFYLENYTLIGWTSDPYSSEPEYEPNEEITIDSDLTLYAVWQGEEVTFSYISPISTEADLLDGLYETDSLYKSRYGELFELPGADAISYGEYTLVGWTSVPYEYGEDLPSVEYSLDAEYLIDDFDIVNNTIELYPCFRIFTKTVIEPTLEKDGKIIYECNDDPDLSYEEIIKKETVFAMYIDDVFSISGRGTVVTGTVKSGALRVGDVVSITKVINVDGVTTFEVVDVTVNGIEMFKKALESCETGDNVGILISDLTTDEVQRGGLIASKDKIILSNNLLLDLDFLTKEQGGRSNPASIGYRPQMFYEGMDATVVLKNAYDLYMNSVTTINPGDSVVCEVETVKIIPIWVGVEIAIREGGRTVAKGKVVARTTEQIADVVEDQIPLTIFINNGPVSVYDAENKIVNYMRTFVDKDTLLKDVESPFVRNGYNLIGYSVPDGNMDEVSSSKASEYAGQILYCCWERINDAEYDLYVTDFRSVNDKHSDYSVISSDTPIKTSFSVGDSVTIYMQDGSEYTGTIESIRWYDNSVDTVDAGSKYVTLTVDSAEFALGASYGDVIRKN